MAVVRNGDISRDGRMVGTAQRYFSPSEADRARVAVGDVLFTGSGDIGKSYLATGEGLFVSNFVKRLRPNTDVVDPRFLYYICHHPSVGSVIDAHAGGSTIRNLRQSFFNDKWFWLPPPDEQRRIVEILEDHLSRLDAALKLIGAIQARLVSAGRLLREQLRMPATGSQQLTLAEIADGGLFVDGDWVESKDQDPSGDVRLTQLADIGVGHFRNRSDRWLRSDQANALDCTYLSGGDLLIARMPDPLARCCLVPDRLGRAVTAVDVAVMRVARPDVDPRWVMWALNSDSFRLRAEALQSGTTRKRISRKNLATLTLALPPLAVQERRVAEYDRFVESFRHLQHEADVAATRSAALRRALLSAAFAGRLTARSVDVNMAEKVTRV